MLRAPHRARDGVLSRAQRLSSGLRCGSRDLPPSERCGMITGVAALFPASSRSVRSAPIRRDGGCSRAHASPSPWSGRARVPVHWLRDIHRREHHTRLGRERVGGGIAVGSASLGIRPCRRHGVNR